MREKVKEGEINIREAASKERALEKAQREIKFEQCH